MLETTLVLCAALLATKSVGRASVWLVADAPLRFELSIDSRPTHSSAGHFVHLPDGGILPGPYPVTQVFTSEGDALESALLWHNQIGGMGIVFADAGRANAVHVYVTGAGRYRLWNPDSGLTPSAILCADPSRRRLIDARALADFGRVGETVHYRNHAGTRQAPLSIGGDLSGRPRPTAFYLLAYLAPQDPGRTWVAPFVISGESDLRIDGTRLTPRERIDKWGGTGQWYDLTDQPHRLDAFHAAAGTERYDSRQTGGLMYLTWRTPNATMEELGGIRSENVPMSGTSRMETRVLRENEIVRSGGASILALRSRDGHPPASVVAEPREVFWFEHEAALILYRMQARREGHPENTQYVWEFPDGGRAVGHTVNWLLPGFQEHRVVLATRSPDGTVSRAVHSFFGYTAERSTSLNNPNTRKAFREAMAIMLEGYPVRPDPVAQWSSVYWNNLMRNLELGQSYPLLRALFEQRAPTLRTRLPPESILALQELFLDSAPSVDARAALSWVERFRSMSTDTVRRAQLLVRAAEIYLYYLDDPNTARDLLASIAHREDAVGALARIRLGDIAFIEGDLNAATRYYAEAQRYVRHADSITRGVYDALFIDEDTRPAEPQLPTGRLNETAGWKLTALLDTAISEYISRLIDENHLLHARQALLGWEQQFPLSKLSGDLILLESRLHQAIGDRKRARLMLQAYCEHIDVSGFLPGAAALLLEIMRDMNTPTDEIRAFGKRIEERLEFHPVADAWRRAWGGE